MVREKSKSKVTFDDEYFLPDLEFQKQYILDNFDFERGVRFSTYAVPMIIGEIRRYLRDNSSVRVSRNLRDIAYKALQAKEKLTAENEKEPTV